MDVAAVVILSFGGSQVDVGQLIHYVLLIYLYF